MSNEEELTQLQQAAHSLQAIAEDMLSEREMVAIDLEDVRNLLNTVMFLLSPPDQGLENIEDLSVYIMLIDSTSEMLDGVKATWIVVGQELGILPSNSSNGNGPVA